MIEVERKFSLHDGDKERLIEDAEFISEKQISDIYYDRSDYSLTTKDIWLRNRNGKFELKVSVNTTKKHSERMVDKYQEIIDENKIREVLGMPTLGSFEEELVASGFSPYGSWITTRTEYKKDGFIIDFDEVNFGLTMVEIELQLPDTSAVKEATEKIMTFAKHHGLDLTPHVGKNTVYLMRFKPDHYQALVKAGII